MGSSKLELAGRACAPPPVWARAAGLAAGAVAAAATADSVIVPCMCSCTVQVYVNTVAVVNFVGKLKE